jgi:hypothetical protein
MKRNTIKGQTIKGQMSAQNVLALNNLTVTAFPGHVHPVTIRLTVE